MAKSIYGYKDVFCPEYIYMAKTEKAAFKFLLENADYSTCKAGCDYFSIERKTKVELITEYSERIKELRSYSDAKGIAKFTFGFNAQMYENKIKVLKESKCNDFVCFARHVLCKAN